MEERAGETGPRSVPLVMSADGFAGFPGAAVLIDRDGRASAVNAGGFRLLGGTSEEAQGLLVTAREVLAAGVVRAEPSAFREGAEALFLPLAGGEGVLALLCESGLDPELRQSLIEGRQRYRDLVEMAGDFAWEVDAGGRFVFVPPRGALAWPAAALLGRQAVDFLADPSQAAVFAATEPLAEGEVWFRRGDGGDACLALTAMPVRDVAGNWIGARGVGRDITVARDRDHTLAQLQLRDRLMVQVVHALRDEAETEAALAAVLAAAGTACGAAGGIILRRVAQPPMRAASSWGAKAAPAALATARNALEQEDGILLIAGGWQILAQATRYRQAVEGAILLWREEDQPRFAERERALLTDVADHLGIALAQIENNERILTLSRSDPLTGLVNRRAFSEEFDRRLARLDRGGPRAVLLYVDVMNLPLINDRHGLGRGDEALVELAGILREHTRAGDLVARYGGGEFLLWIEGLDPAAAAQRADRLRRSCQRLASMTDDPARPFGIAIGIAAYDPAQRDSPASLIARAGAAARANKAAQGALATLELP